MRDIYHILVLSVHLLMNFDKGYFMSQEGAHYTVEQIVIIQYVVLLLLLTLLHLIVKVITLVGLGKTSGHKGKQHRGRAVEAEQKRNDAEQVFFDWTFLT